MRIFHHRVLTLIAILPGLMRGASLATAKPHVVAFGKWISVQCVPESSVDGKPLSFKVRPLVVDTRVREFTLGPAHDVTDRLFVVRRAFRVNDSLPQESDISPRWQWQRGGWLLVDRVSGHVSSISLPEFDAFYSGISWYRDYAAYCTISEDGKKVYALVAQIGRRKPVLKKLIEGATVDEGRGRVPDSACPLPSWQRAPTRVTFEGTGGAKQTFTIRGHVVDSIATEDDEDEEADK